MQAIEVPTRFGRIAGLSWGDVQGPIVLAWHGWLDNAASFAHLAPHLAERGFRVMALDFPGHGHSDHRAEGHAYSFLDYVLDMHEVHEALLGDRPAVYLCHSMGAAVAQMYLSAFPEHARHLVLIENVGPVPPHVPGQAVPTLRKALKQWARHSLEHSRHYARIEDAVAARIEATPMPAEIIRPLVERGLHPSDDGLHWRTDKRLRLNSLMRVNEQQVMEFLAGNAVPTHLILSDPLTYAMDYPMREARIAALKPRWLDHLPGGHHLHMTQADAVARAILINLEPSAP